MQHYEVDTWQEGAVWYAAPLYCDSDAPVGWGDTEEDAILNLRVQIEELAEENRLRGEALNDEP